MRKRPLLRFWRPSREALRFCSTCVLRVFPNACTRVFSQYVLCPREVETGLYGIHYSPPNPVCSTFFLEGTDKLRSFCDVADQRCVKSSWSASRVLLVGNRIRSPYHFRHTYNVVSFLLIFCFSFFFSGHE